MVERERLLRRAEKLVARGKIEGAIVEYKKVLKELPNDTTLLNLVGDLFARVNRTPEAVEQYERTAQRFASEGFFVKAIAVLKKVLRLAPGRFDIYERLADLYRRQGLLKEAVEQYLALAKHYVDQDEREDAVDVYQRVIEIEPQNLSHRSALAQLYQELGQPVLVLKEYHEIARFMLAHDRVDEATKVLYSGLDIDATNVKFVREALGLLRESGRSDLAAEFLEEAERRTPELGDLSVEAAEALEAEDTTGRAPGAQSGRAPAPPTLDRGRGGLFSDSPSTPGASGSAGPRPASEADELLAEAQVFVKYGLQQKALDRLEEVLQIAPRNLSAHSQLIALLLEQENFDRVVQCSNRMALKARERGDLLPWNETRIKLEEAGFVIEGDEVVSTPLDPKPEDVGVLETVGPEVLEEARPLFEQDGVAVPPGGPGNVGPGGLTAVEPEKRAEVEPARREEVEQDSLADLGEFEDAAVHGFEISDSLDSVTVDDSSELESLIASDTTTFLDNLSTQERQSAREVAALEAESAAEQVSEVASSPASAPHIGAPGGENGEESVREIVQHFTEGVIEHLPPEDSDTHYNLGIAFREMGLLDEAIGEFETASRAPDLRLSCYSLLSECHRESGQLDQAIQSCRNGLAEPDLSSEQQLAFLYEMAECQTSGGDSVSAHQTLVQIHGIEPQYRDVADRLADFSD